MSRIRLIWSGGGNYGRVPVVAGLDGKGDRGQAAGLVERGDRRMGGGDERYHERGQKRAR